MRIVVEAKNAAVGIEDGRIVPATGRIDAVIRVLDGELRPGLINAHDHLHRNHYGRLGAPPYANAYAWGDDIQTRCAEAIDHGRLMPRRDALLAGAWKNLYAGVTTVVHHDPWEPAFDGGFPLRVARLTQADSLGRSGEIAGPIGCIHVAEGIDAEAAAEIRQLDRLGCLTPSLLAVHVVGADDDGIRRLRDSGAAVVWCPSSNFFLFGRTIPTALIESGIDILLGSDSLLTGIGSLLDELRFARDLGIVSDERLIDAVGATAARRLGLPAPSLDEGAPADVIVLRRPLLEATEDDVALVIVDGIPRVIDGALG